MQLTRAFFVLVLLSTAFADTLTLQNGSVFKGTFVGAVNRYLIP